MISEPARYIFLGSLILLLMGMAVILFVIYYQRKQLKSQNTIQEMKNNYQRQMLANSLAVQELVRRKISNDLHDEIGGLLSATKLSISSLSKNADPSIKDKIENAKNLVTEALAQVRSISRDLVPRTLENFGMVSAIEEFVQKMKEATSVKFSFAYPNEDKRHDPNVELTVYRVIQELTNNSLKHANAENIFIEIEPKKDKIIIKFTDDGKGFDLEQILKTKGEGLGIGNILSRLDVIGGSYTFEANRKRGVSFLISIPSKNNNE